jgi:hypothetical protein
MVSDISSWLISHLYINSLYLKLETHSGSPTLSPRWRELWGHDLLLSDIVDKEEADPDTIDHHHAELWEHHSMEWSGRFLAREATVKPPRPRSQVSLEEFLK